MVKDSLSAVKSHKQNDAGQTGPEGESGSAQRDFSSATGQAESQEPAERRKLNFGEELEFLDEQPAGAEADDLPTHLRPFSSADEYRLVKRTYQQLQHSGYYWGEMTMEEAHAKLSRAPLGTFLIRDSGQSDVFFTLSYQSGDGPTSVRVQLRNLLFNLCGSQRTFACFFALLTHYTGSACTLTAPYRRQRPERLKQMCRRALVRAHGAEHMGTLPGLSTPIRDYVCAYPHCI